MQLTQEQIDGIVLWAISTPEVAEVYLFGSRVKGNAKETSDLDVAIAFDIPDDAAQIAFFDFGRKWRRQLKDATGLHIGLDPLVADTANVRSYVADHGVRIYQKLKWG